MPILQHHSFLEAFHALQPIHPSLAVSDYKRTNIVRTNNWLGWDLATRYTSLLPHRRAGLLGIPK